MFGKLLLLFVAVPLVELAILVKLGTLIGFWPTIGLVLLTGVVGTALARSEGFRVWREIQRELRAGRMPVGRLMDGLMVLVGGVLLLTPGVLSDLTGLSLLFPPTRALYKRWVRRKFEKMVRSKQVNFRMMLR